MGSTCFIRFTDQKILLILNKFMKNLIRYTKAKHMKSRLVVLNVSKLTKYHSFFFFGHVWLNTIHILSHVHKKFNLFHLVFPKINARVAQCQAWKVRKFMLVHQVRPAQKLHLLLLPSIYKNIYRNLDPLANRTQSRVS